MSGSDTEIVELAGIREGMRLHKPTAWFPDIIDVPAGAPVSLDEALGTSSDLLGLRIVKVNDVEIDPDRPTVLPGIRIDSDQGGGYVLRRQFDGQLIFCPDDSFKGLSTFSYTIRDALGDEATVMAILRGRDEPEPEGRLSFTDGTNSVTVAGDADIAIIGTLCADGAPLDAEKAIVVYEGGSSEPSQRFVVTGGKLVLRNDCEASPQQERVELIIVVADPDREPITAPFIIDLQPAGAALRPGLEHLNQGADLDRFHFLAPCNGEELPDEVGTSGDEAASTPAAVLPSTVVSPTDDVTSPTGILPDL